MLRHHLIVQDIAKAREAAGGGVPMLIGWVKGSGAKGKDVKGKGEGVLMQVRRGKDVKGKGKGVCSCRLRRRER